MNAPHRIEELALAIEFDGGDGDARSDDRLTRLAQEILLPIIDELLDRYDDPGKVVRIERLELDLGVIVRADFAHDMGQRLRAQLDDALTRALKGRQVAPGGHDGEIAVVTLDRRRSALEELASFLHTGRMPWHADIARDGLQVEALDKLLQDGGDSLWITLDAALDDPQAARRLVSQYPPRQLEQIVRCAASRYADELLAIVARANAGERARLWQLILPAALRRTVTPSFIAQLGAGSAVAGEELRLLERFLATGQWHGPHDAPALVLERLLASANEGLWRALAAVATDPRSMRRLVTQFPDRQLLAILRGAAPALATQLCAMFEHVRAAADAPEALESCRALILAAGLGLVAVAPIRAQVLAAGGRESLQRFLDAGEWNASIGTPADVISYLLEQQDPFVRAILAHAVSSESGARRLLAHVGEPQLTAIVSGGAHAPELHAMEELVRAANLAAPALREARTLILAVSLEVAEPGLSIAEVRARIVANLAGKEPAAPAVRMQPMDAAGTLSHLERYLRTGRWDLSPQTPGQALGRLMAQGGDALRRLLADALAHEGSAQRLLTRFSAFELQEIVRRAGREHAPELCELMDLVGAAHAPPSVVLACRSSILGAAVGAPLSDSALRALRARLAGMLEMPAAAAKPASDIERLERFLVIGQWSPKNDTPADALERLLARSQTALWAVLEHALAEEASARRLLLQCSESHLLAIVRGAGGGHAPQLGALMEVIDQASAPPAIATAARSLILGAALAAQRGDLPLGALRARLDALLATHTAPAGAGMDIEKLERFLQTGAWDWSADTPVDAMERLLAGEQAALRAMLLTALANDASARRLIAQFPAHQLVAILTRSAPEHAASLASWNSGATPVSADALRAALLPDAAGDAPPILLARLRRFLHTGDWAAALGSPQACLDALLPEGGDALWTMLAEALAQEACAERVLRHFSHEHLMAIVQARSPRQLATVRHAMHAFRHAPRQQRDQQWRWLLCACLSGRLDTVQPPAPARRLAARVAGVSQGRDVLGPLERFLHAGQWLGADMNHVAAMDLALAGPGEPLWAMLVDALAAPAPARRLVDSFPERQLAAILQRSAGPHAAALERQLARLRDLIRTQRHSGFSEKEAMSVCWQGLLAAAVASGAVQCDAEALGTSIAAKLTPTGAGLQNRTRVSALSELLAFLATGRWETTSTAGTGHVAMLDAVLDHEPEALVKALRRLAGRPDALRRLALQFPARQLRAIVLLAAPGRDGTADEALRDAPAWQGVLAIALGAQDGAAAAQADAPGEQLARFFLSGSWTASSNPVEALDSLLEAPDEVLWSALSTVLERSDSAWRLVTRLPERQLQSILRLAAPGCAAELNALLDQWRGKAVPRRVAELGPDRIMQVCWRRVLAAAVDAAAVLIEPDRIAAAIAAELCALTELAPDALRIVAYLGTGAWDGPHAAPVDMMQKLLDQGGADLRTVFGAALGDADQVRRLVDAFPEAQLARILRLVAPNSAHALAAMTDDYRDGRDDAHLLLHRSWRQVLAGAAACDGHDEALPALRARIADQLAGPLQLAQLIDSGAWPHAESPERVFERARHAAPRALWEALRRSLRGTAGIERLLARLPERHWRWLLEQGAGAQAAPLLQLVEQLHAQGGTSQLAALREPALIVHCWREVLAAVASAGPAVAVGPLRTRILSELVARAPVPRSAPTPIADVARSDRRRLPAQKMARALRRLARPSARTGIRPIAHQSSASWSEALMADPVDANLLAIHLVNACAAVERAMRCGAGDAAAALRGSIVARLDQDRRMAAEHRAILLQTIDRAAAEAPHPARFLDAVAAAIDKGGPLDLDAIASAGVSLTQMIADVMAKGDPAPLIEAWRSLASDQPVLVKRALRHYGASPMLRAVLAVHCPDGLLHDLVGLFDPALAAGAGLAVAAPAAFRDLIGPGWKPALWEALLASALGAQPAPDWLKAAGGSGERALALQGAWCRLADPALPASGMALGRKQADAGTERARSRPRHRAEPEAGEYIALVNAGMVLAGPYLPRLMDMLGLVKEGRFPDEAAAERAVHLLQFMVSGQAAAPEYQLALNKLLCGMALEAPVAAGIEITPSEQATIEGLLQALIGSWTAIGKTSIDGLRQSFLQRKGELRLADDAWQLKILDGPFDMLLDRLPWSFSIIKFGWMERAIHVTWR